jgi:hypothetical protein
MAARVERMKQRASPQDLAVATNWLNGLPARWTVAIMDALAR